MENIKIALITDNREYGRALGRGLLNVCRTFVIHLFDKDGFLSDVNKFYDENKDRLFLERFDLILWDGEEIKSYYGGNIIYISEKLSAVKKNFDKKKFCIYKYNCAKGFVADIFEIYGSLTGALPVNAVKESVKFLAFESWAGGTGCSSLSMMASQELCRFYGRRVLYISFETIESTENFIENHSGAQNVGRYLYNLFKEGKSKPFIESYIIRDEFGVEAFSPTKGRNPLKDMSEKEFYVFLESICDSGRYDTVVMDLGNCLDNVNLSCIEIAEHICMVTVPENNVFRESQYMQYLMCRFGESILEKVIRIENMCEKIQCRDDKVNQDEQTADSFTDVKLYMNKERYFTDKNKINRISDEGAFSEKISELAGMLMEPA